MKRVKKLRPAHFSFSKALFRRLIASSTVSKSILLQLVYLKVKKKIKSLKQFHFNPIEKDIL